MFPLRPSIMLHARKQQGAALMLMLVILVLGAATVLVSSLNSSRLKMERDKITADALAQAKEALIGRAVGNDDRPGSLPCPDQLTNILGTNVPNDGAADLLSGNDCPSYIGRLPWKTLKLPDLRDGNGERLWYALSTRFRDDGSAEPINPDISGNLIVSGVNLANNVVAIVFSAGSPVIGQSRSPTTLTACSTQSGAVITENLCGTNYLEQINAAPSTAASPNLNYQFASITPTFNDQLMLVNSSDLFSKVEQRVAKELQLLLQSYKDDHGVYPYPAKFTECKESDCSSDNKECSGWIPVDAEPNNWTLPDWFKNNAWYRVIYYRVGTDGLNPHNNGGGGGGWDSSCNITLDISGTPVTGLFFMPGNKLGGVIRPGITVDPNNTDLPNYLEDGENNDNNDHVFVRPGTTTSTNDLLFVLP